MFSQKNKKNGILNAHVLLLNQSYEPLTVCSVKKAIILIFLAKAETVINKEELKLHSAMREYSWPSVIRLKEYQKVPYKKIILNRKNILKRDGHKCAYCGRGDLQLTIDHILPKALGGKDSWENLVTACLPCNSKKGDTLLANTKMQLRVKPHKPNHISFIKNLAGRVDTRWEPFLFLDSHTKELNKMTAHLHVAAK